MRGKWREVHLGDVAEIVMGQSPPGSTYNESGDGLPFFQGVKDFGYRNPTPRVFCSRPSRVAQPGDILFSVRAPIGRVNIADRECTIGRGLSIIQPRDKAGSRYIEFALRYLEPTWQAIEGGGSVFGNATRQDVELLSLTWPDEVSDRRIIAEVLGSLDDKIELNRRMNATLESMAKAVFKAWFVENEEAKGWKVGQFSDIAQNIRRGVNPADVSPEMPYIGLEHMPRRSIALSEWGRAGDVTSNKFKFQRGEILFGKLRPYFHKVGIAPINGVCSTDVLVVAPKNPEDFGLVLGYISSEDFVNSVNAASEGTKMPRTNWDTMARYPITIPDGKLAADFTAMVQPMIEKIQNNIDQSRTLAALRDALLPRLMSGEVRVKDLEEIR